MAMECSESDRELFIPLLEASKTLPDVVSDHLTKMNVADALETIVDVLRLVGVMISPSMSSG